MLKNNRHFRISSYLCVMRYVKLSNSSEVLTLEERFKHHPKVHEGSNFCSVLHSHLVNLNHINKNVRGDGGYVVMSNNDVVNVVRNRKEIFLESFSKF